MVAPTRYVYVLTIRSMNATLFEKGVFADAIKWRITKWDHLNLGWEDTQEKANWRCKQRLGWCNHKPGMSRIARQLPAAKVARKDSLLEPQEWVGPVTPGFWTSGIQHCARICCCPCCSCHINSPASTWALILTRLLSFNKGSMCLLSSCFYQRGSAYPKPALRWSLFMHGTLLCNFIGPLVSSSFFPPCANTLS